MTRLHITVAQFTGVLPSFGHWLRPQKPTTSEGGRGSVKRSHRRDGPRSWVVASAAFASMFFSIGLSFGTVGVMTVAIGERFKGASRSDLSWVGGLRMLFTFCTGIASSALHNRIGSRRLQMAGAIIVCGATGVSSLATELWHLYVTFGALAGIGLSMVFTSASVAVDGLFDRYLHVALSLAQLGGAVGMSVFPASARAVVGSLGFQGSLYVLCGLSFTPALCALLYVDARRQRGGSRRPAASGNGSEAREQASVAVASSTPSAHDHAAGEISGPANPSTSSSPSTQAASHLAQSLDSTLTSDTAERDGIASATQEIKSAERHQTIASADNVPDARDNVISAKTEPTDVQGDATKTGYDRAACEGSMTISFDTAVATAATSNASTAQLGETFPLPEAPTTLPTGDGLDVIQTISAANTLPVDDGQQSAVIQPSKSDSLPTRALARSLPSATSASASSKGDATLLRRMLRLLTAGDTWMGLLHFFCRQYTSSAIVVLLPTLATSGGRLSAEAGTVSLTVLFAATVPGHVTTVALGARAFNRMLLAVVACVLLGSATMACAPALASVKSFYPLCAFAGYWLGMVLGLFMSVLKQLCGEKARLADAFGLTAFASGLGGLAGPAVSGVLLNVAEPETTLYVTGAVAILAGVSLLVPAFRGTRRRTGEDVERAAAASEDAAQAATSQQAAVAASSLPA